MPRKYSKRMLKKRSKRRVRKTKNKRRITRRRNTRGGSSCPAHPGSISSLGSNTIEKPVGYYGNTNQNNGFSNLYWTNYGVLGEDISGIINS
jgi:hypothetical protein